jgi:hypothetical protein
MKNKRTWANKLADFYFGIDDSNRERKTTQKIYVSIPRNFFNCGVTTDNRFTADTNDSANWDTIDFPLPKPKTSWIIHSYTGTSNTTVVLIDKK